MQTQLIEGEEEERNRHGVRPECTGIGRKRIDVCWSHAHIYSWREQRQTERGRTERTKMNGKGEEQREDERPGLVPVTVDPPKGDVCPHT